jgi:hypothetical protein
MRRGVRTLTLDLVDSLNSLPVRNFSSSSFVHRFSLFHLIVPTSLLTIASCALSSSNLDLSRRQSRAFH